MNESQWLVSEDPIAMFLVAAHGAASLTTDRKLRLFACACCRSVWHLLGDERSRRVVEVAERYADGEVSREELGRALVGGPGGFVSHSQRTDELVRLFYATAEPGFFVFAGQLRNLGRGWEGEMPDSDWHERWLPVWADLLRDVVGNPFRQPLFFKEQPWTPPSNCGVAGQDLECVECSVKLYGRRAPCPLKPPPVKIVLYQPSEEITRLATAAYEERCPQSGELDPARLAILADAVEEAGCTEELLLRHLRDMEPCQERTSQGYECKNGQLFYLNSDSATCHRCNGTGWMRHRGAHVRGCWALDLILGKE
jgi:hypothetical protein